MATPCGVSRIYMLDRAKTRSGARLWIVVCQCGWSDRAWVKVKAERLLFLHVNRLGGGGGLIASAWLALREGGLMGSDALLTDEELSDDQRGDPEIL